MEQQRAVVSVIGVDQVGIIAKVTSILAEYDANILDISQTIMQEFFTMMMVIDLAQINAPIDEMRTKLSELGKSLGLDIRVQQEKIFNAMHRI